MHKPNAKEILQALIEGFDPLTGEELPPGTVLQRAEVIRALLAGVTALESSSARALRRANLPRNVGRPWTTAEEQQLIASFRAGEDLRAIAADHGRTLNAVESRLEKLGLITADQRITRSRFTPLPPSEERASNDSSGESGADSSSDQDVS